LRSFGVLLCSFHCKERPFQMHAPQNELGWPAAV
jgi:hypothetical protein